MHCAESVGTDVKLLGTAPVRVLPPIVPAPTAGSMAAGRLNRRWDGMRTAYARKEGSVPTALLLRASSAALTARYETKMRGRGTITEEGRGITVEVNTEQSGTQELSPEK
jgi:hypothetical protein